MTFGKRLKQARESVRPKLTQAALGERLGVSAQAVSGWERDQDAPENDKLAQIAKEVNVSLDWLFEHDHVSSEDIAASDGGLSSEDVAAFLPDPPSRKTVKLKGYVGASSSDGIHFYRFADDAFDEVPAPPGATDKTIAVEIRGKSWGPALESWLVFYDDVRSPIEPNMLGKACILGLSDDRILLKIPFKQPNGMFRLLSNSDEPPIEDAEIEWAALVTSMAPRT